MIPPAGLRSDCSGIERARQFHRRGVTVISPEVERRVYFLATLALAAWYLLDLLL